MDFLSKNGQKILLAEETMEVFDQVPISGEIVEGDAHKLDCIVRCFNNLYIKAKEELHGLFEKSESMFLIQLYNGTSFEYEQDAQKRLLADIEMASELEGLDKMYDINKDKLMSKIMKLSEIQCIAVFGMIQEFWNMLRRNETCEFMDDDIKKIF